MPALNFKNKFADAVESGLKLQTIRARRKDNRNPREGQTLYMYTGMRTKKCRKIGEFKCKFVDVIKIDKGLIQIGPYAYHDHEEYARRDGFESSSEFFDFFENEHGLPFEGLVICW